MSDRPETYLRLLAEEAVRTAPQASSVLGHADRVRRAADILVDAGVLDDDQATEILLILGTALRIRGVPGALAFGRSRRIVAMAARSLPLRPAQSSPGRPSPRQLLARTQAASAAAEGTWQVIPEVPLPGQVTGSRLMALIVSGDRMVAPATLRFPPSAGLAELALPSFSDLTASDDVDTSYMVSFTDGAWAGSTWTGIIMLRPSPPPGARLLTILSHNGPVLLVQLAPASPTAQAEASLQAVEDSAGERMLRRRAESLLGSLIRPVVNPGSVGPLPPPEHRSQALAQIMQTLSTTVSTTAAFPPGARTGPQPMAVVSRGTQDIEPDLAELVATLEGGGVLSPLSSVPAEVAALGQALGDSRFATFSANGIAPANLPRLPTRWAAVLAYYGRRHQPPFLTGAGSIGAVLPEADGVRFVVAGVRTGAQGSVLYVVARGLRTMTRPAHDTGFSWWIRDDSDGWHLGVVEGWHPANDVTALRLNLLPPLRPGDPGTSGTLTLDLTGPSHHLTARLKVRW